MGTRMQTRGRFPARQPPKSPAPVAMLGGNARTTLSLPRDLQILAISYLDTCRKLMVMRVSKSQRIVCANQPILWRTVQIHSEPRLTDQHLHAILHRTGASQCIETLSLRGCTALRGLGAADNSGLKSLCGSRTLRVLDLRPDAAQMKSEPYGPGWLNAAQMIQFVGSFTSHSKLERVLFRQQSSEANIYHCYNEGFSDLKEALTNLRQAQSLAQNASCACGKLLSCYEGTDDDYVLRLPSCWGCSKTRCNDCCMELDECSVCQVAMCQNCVDEECRMVDCCDTCEKAFCEECRTVNFCHAYGKPFCEECRKRVGPTLKSQCSNCGNIFCSGC